MRRHLAKIRKLCQRRELLIIVTILWIVTTIYRHRRLHSNPIQQNQVREVRKDAIIDADKFFSYPPTKAPEIQDYTLSFHHQKTYTNEEMITVMFGKEKAMDFITADKKCNVNDCPHKKTMKYNIPNANACAGHKKNFFLLVVYTSTGNFQQRAMIRKTWGKPNLFSEIESTTIFLIGTTQAKIIKSEIWSESEEHKDIVQADYHDSYENLSLKGRSMIQWISKHCSTASYLIKADDDQYLDIFKVVRILLRYPLPPRFIFGHIKKGVIKRNSPGKKINVRNDLFPGMEKYPMFLHGATYVMVASTTMMVMNEIANTTPIFHLDDVYMTGVLAGQIRKLSHYSYSAKPSNGTFQPTYPNLNVRMKDVEDIRKTWCKHADASKEKYPSLFNDTTLEQSLKLAKCDEQDPPLSL